MTITQQRVTDNEVESSNKHENLHRKVSFTLHNHHHETDNEGSNPHNHRHEKMLIENEGVETSSMMMPSSGDTPLLRKTSSLRNLTSTSSLSLGEDRCVCDILGGSLHDDLKRVSSVGCTKMHRSQSCGVRSEAYRHCGTGVRFHIGYQDENLKERCQRNTHELLQTAAKQATVESTSTILARKALRYRRIMERMQGADVNNPAFDLTEHLGVRWERVIPQSISMDQEDEKEEEEKEEG